MQTLKKLPESSPKTKKSQVRGDAGIWEIVIDKNDPFAMIKAIP
jgi:hypothetical protein